MSHCMYLRKSRVDAEAEAHGEEETLARHEKALIELARKLHLGVITIYREIGSGETIESRPVMQRLLTEVENGLWDGVLVMEVERLARGDTIDQGILAQAFKYSNTKIITPTKTYDPNNEFDEEYFEFGLFMSRREYKTINRRLQRGRLASVKEGKYVGNKTPYGYKRVRLENEKGWTLEIVEDEADIIKMIFDWYAFGERQTDGSYKRLGTSLIVRRLNAMKVVPKMGGTWAIASIRDILINPVYIGKVRWNWRPVHKKIVNGQVSIERPRSNIDECVIADGLHPAIIDDEIFYKVQELMSKNPPRPVGERNTVKNPLAGIVVCGKCGRRMVRRPLSDKNKADILMCAATSCNNISVALHYVESRILKSLSEWLGNYKLKLGFMENPQKSSEDEVIQKTIKRLNTELVELNKQLDNVHTQFERGIYTTEQFLSRSNLVSERIIQTKENIADIDRKLKIESVKEYSRRNIIPKIEELLKVYSNLPTPGIKNDTLKEVLEKVEYIKEKNGRWHNSPDDFEIVIHPKLPMYDDLFE